MDEVKNEITSELGENNKKNVQLTAQDREKIIELMLSQERVLSLLYEKTIPSRAVTRENIGGPNESDSSDD